MEFTLGAEFGELLAPADAGAPQDIKALITLGVEVARLVASLQPRG